jgi:peptidoglycan/xylan/chitin deacetylase (PgdA/CDA1 family)
MSKRPIPILMYHSIESMPKSTKMRSLHVPTMRFGFQMWLLNILGYKGLSMRELRPYLEGKKIGKVVGITFDDGYQNNLINAAPILKKYNFSATCYIVSQRIGTSNSWDIGKGITQSRLMTILEIKEWLNLGLDIGAHSQTHPSLDKLSAQESLEEIFNSKTDLEQIFKVSIQDFCYPFGQFDETLVNMTKEAGYITATSMIRGRATRQSNKFKLPRIPITHHTLPYLFLTKILTNYEDNRKHR